MNGPATRCRVVLVDDHAVVRTGTRRLLEVDGDVVVVAEHGDADAAYAALVRAAPGDAGCDVMVLDLSMPGRSGLDLMRRLRVRWPALRVLVFSMHDSPAMVGQALAAGAAGFVTKGSPPETLLDAVRRVARGETVLSDDVASVVDAPGARAPHDALSAREFEVLHGLVQGLSVDEIAQRLHLSAKTVANHQSALRAKLGAQNALDLLRVAREHRLLP